MVGVVIIGGIKRIASVTDKLVPFMAALHRLAGLVVILLNITHVPAAFGAILGGAFSPEGVAGGFVGALIQGVRRATLFNEAGIDSAAIAHPAVRTEEPITEGLVALHGPFIDTVVIWTTTALVIVISGACLDKPDLSGGELTSAAFGSVVGWFPLVLASAVVPFAFTILSYSYTILSYSYHLVKGGVSVRRGCGDQACLKAVLPFVHRPRCHHGSRAGDRLFRCDAVLDGHPQHRRALLLRRRGEAGSGILRGSDRQRHDPIH